MNNDRAEYDESAIAREMAERAGAEFHPIPLHQSDLAEHFGDAIRHSETLCLNAHGVAKFVLSRAVRDAGYKVVITGEGSDEILGGYPPFRRDMLPKIHEVDTWRRERGLAFRLEVDGGIDIGTAGECRAAGADTFVAGTSFFRSDDQRAFVAAIDRL